MDLYESVVSHYVEMLKKLLAKPRYSFADASSRDVPKAQGVYLIYDKRTDVIIYAGRTKNLNRRLLGDHKRGNVRSSQFRKVLGRNFSLDSEDEITSYILRKCSFQFMALEEFEEIIRLEHFATAVLAPLLNIRLKR